MPNWWNYAGEVPMEARTVKQALTATGLDWDVDKRPTFTIDHPLSTIEEQGLTKGILPAGIGLHDPEGFALVRQSDNFVLGRCGRDFQVIRNSEQFSFLDPLIEGEGKVARIEMAGALRGGRTVWVMVNLVESEIIIANGDKVLPYIMIVNHFGGGSFKAHADTFRPICQNTLMAAIGGRYKDAFGSLSVSIRHSGDTQHKLKMAQLMMAEAATEFGAFKEAANKLAETEIKKDAFEELVGELFPIPDEEGAAQTRAKNQRNLFAQSMAEEIKLLPAPSGPANPLSGWTVLNGITRYADHARQVKPGKRDINEARFESNLLGSNADFKGKATATLMKIAGFE